MQGYNFTERVRKTLNYAREEAARLHHEYVGSEHILLGIVREGEGIASTIIENRGVKLETVRQAVEGLVKKGKASEQVGPDLPYTSRAKKVLECAMLEAREAGHTYVGTEHLLLGLLREEKGVGAQVLVSLGITLENARASMIEILGTSARDSKDALPSNYLVGVAPLPARVFFSGRRVFTVAAVLSWLIGLVLIFDPIHFEARMDLVVDDRLATIAQAQGAILIGLGFINWLMRRVTDRSAMFAVLYGNFVVQVLSFTVVLRALVHGFIPMSGVSALFMHVILGAAFVWQMVRLRRG